MQPTTSLSPPLQVLLLQLFNLAVQNISRSAPVPGLGDVCVVDRSDLKATRVTMGEIIREFGEQDKKFQRLDNIIENKFLEQINRLNEVSQNSNSALEKMFQKEFRKLEDQIDAQYQKLNACDEIREEYRLYKQAVKALLTGPDSAEKLLAAAKSGDTAAVKVLVDAGVDVGVTDDEGYTPLHRAAKDGHSDTVQALLNLGAKFDAVSTSGYDVTPLYLAAKFGKVDVCRVLIAAGADVHYKRKVGWTSLHAAAEHGGLEVCRLLLDSGANIDEPGENNYTPLHMAAWYDRVDVVRLLLERGADSNLKSKNGKTPLDLARSEGYTKVVAALTSNYW